MMEKIEERITEIVSSIINKPTSKITKRDYDILASEYFRLKQEKDAKESNKRMTEMLATLWTK